MEGQNAVAEVAYRRHASPWIAENGHRTDVRAAFPASNEAAAAKNFPAVGIGDGKRQAAVGKTISRRVHPTALDRSRTNVQFVSFQNIGGEFHAIHICKIIQKPLAEVVSVRDCLISLSNHEKRARFGRGKAATCYAQGGMPKRPCVVLASVSHAYPQLSTASLLF